MDIEDIVNYLCELKGTEYTYEGLANYRNYLALYFAGKKAINGKKIYINARHINNEYRMNLNYYQTSVEKIKIDPDVNYYFKFVNISSPDSSHSTLLILDNREHKAYYIDPNGYTTLYSPAYLVIADYLRFHASEYNLSLQLQSCIIGPQSISRDEFCANWTLLLLYLKLNTEKSIDEIINTLISYDMITLNRLMNNWTCYLWSLVRNLHLDEIAKYLSSLLDLMPINKYLMLSDFVNNMIKQHLSDIALNILTYEYQRYNKT